MKKNKGAPPIFAKSYLDATPWQSRNTPLFSYIIGYFQKKSSGEISFFYIFFVHPVIAEYRKKDAIENICSKWYTYIESL